MRGLQSKVEVKDIRTECRTVICCNESLSLSAGGTGYEKEKHGLFVGDAP